MTARYVLVRERVRGLAAPQPTLTFHGVALYPDVLDWEPRTNMDHVPSMTQTRQAFRV